MVNVQQDFRSYFSDDRVVRYLCRRRLAATQENRRSAFLSGITSNAHVATGQEIRAVLPPRKFWPRAGRDKRRTEKDPQGAMGRLLAVYVMQCLRERASYKWVQRLRTLIDRIQFLIAGDCEVAWEYRPRRIVAIPKGADGSGQRYRVLAIYGLEESILGSCLAAYLRDGLEPHLGPECIAFRAGLGRPPPTHHDAVARIKAFREQLVPGRRTWVAECDIKSFFDAVHHDVVVKCVSALGLCPDVTALSFLAKFLAGYDYASAVGDAREVLSRRGIRNPVFGQVSVSVKLASSRVGVPQGSAISCVLANAVLRAADRACLAADSQCRGLYLRYCDDIVIAHPVKKTCAKMLAAYMRELRRCRLPAHPAADCGAAYGAEFWKSKSKKPYRWSADGRSESVPWLAFVGYHIHRDGRVRVRPSSIDKELRKQQQSVERLLSSVAHTRDVGPGGVQRLHRGLAAVLYRFKMHLLAFGVGIPDPRRPVVNADRLCWVAGFTHARGGASVGRVSLLDRGRLIAIRRLVGRLRGLERRARLALSANGARSERGYVIKFIGYPYSYAAQMRKTLPVAV